MRSEGVARLVASLLLGRVAGQMLTVSLVLFVLSRYHSPQLAGYATSLLVLPGLLLSPIAGALLDRYGRARLIALDYVLAAATLFLMAGLSIRHALPPALLLGICGISSLTGPLSAAGARSMFPTVVPGHLWERANALDSSTGVLAGVIGAPLAGVLVGFAGGEWALGATASLFLLAGLAVVGIHDPSIKQRGTKILAEARSGLVYVFRNRSLVGLALTFFAFTIGWGCLVIAMPVLVLGRLHQGPAAVGYVWGAVGAAGLVSTLITGRLKTHGRERILMAGSIVAVAIAMAAMPFATSVLVVAAALVAVAIVETPFDIAFLTLRQRRTDPTRFGRVFAVSMSLNVVGTPVGLALAGPLIAWSLNGALWFAVAATLIGAVFPLLVIPARDES
ncbi:MAG: MFS transporter [Chloroflexi bacterium]|nr:MAG: MFS transporter [Chloroflexota bacterium]